MMLNITLSLGCLIGVLKNCPLPISNAILNNRWNPTNPYQSEKHASGVYITNKPQGITSLKGMKIKVAVINEPPFVEDYFATNRTVKGRARTMLGVLRDALGIDWEVYIPPDNNVGVYNYEEKKFNGIMRMLIDGEVDMALTFMSMIPERTEQLDFSRPFGEEKWSIMMRRPQETTDGDGLVAPFQVDVWYCLLIALVAMGPFCYVMIRLRCWLCPGHDTLSVYYTMGDTLWFVYGALMKQGSVLKPAADSTRILFATWWIFVTILTAFYTANLTAYLTLSKIPIPYDSLKKIGYNTYWVARKGDTMEAIIKAGATDFVDNFAITGDRYPQFDKMRYNYEKYGQFLSNYSTIVEEVRRRKVILIDEESRIQSIIYRDFRELSKRNLDLSKRCAFIMSREPVFRIPYGFAFRKNSTIKHLFDPVLDKLAKGGLFDYWREKDLPVVDPCSADSDFRERQLRNGDLKSTYILCALGYFSGLLSFIFEILIKYIIIKRAETRSKPAAAKETIGFYKGNVNLPPGNSTIFDTEKFLKNINGRDYIVVKTVDGRTKLVPKNDGMQALKPVYQPPPPITYGFMS